MADQDFGDLVLIEQLLELTVRNGLDLCVDQPHVLDQHHAKEGRKDVPDGEVVLSLLGLLGRLRGFRPRSLVAVVAEAEKPREAPTGRRFHVLGRLVEHVGLPRSAAGHYRRRRPAIRHPKQGAHRAPLPTSFVDAWNGADGNRKWRPLRIAALALHSHSNERRADRDHYRPSISYQCFCRWEQGQAAQSGAH